MHPYIEIFSWQIPTYGIMAVLGILVAALFIVLENRRYKPQLIEINDLVNLMALIAVGVLIGAKLLYILTMLPALIQNWAAVSAHWSTVLSLLTSGGVFYGGLFGGIVAVIIYCRKYQISLQNAAQLFTCAIPLFHVFGRIGCFMAGCCWGIETEGWGIIYSHSHLAPNGITLVPVQLIESFANLLLFFLLFFLLYHLKKPWQIFPIYLTCYAAMRFVLEFFRGDELRGVWMLSTSQWISFLVLIGVGLWFLRYKRAERLPKETPAVALPTTEQRQ